MNSLTVRQASRPLRLLPAVGWAAASTFCSETSADKRTDGHFTLRWITAAFVDVAPLYPCESSPFVRRWFLSPWLSRSRSRSRLGTFGFLTLHVPSPPLLPAAFCRIQRRNRSCVTRHFLTVSGSTDEGGRVRKSYPPINFRFQPPSENHASKPGNADVVSKPVHRPQSVLRALGRF